MRKYFFTFYLLTVFLTFSLENLASELPSFSDLADKSSPAVVNISSSKMVKTNSNRGFSPT